MCAIFGLFNPRQQQSERESAIRAMAQSLKHRGPNDWGDWHEASGLSLGHTRLSILDLSPLGHQPMISPCGRYTLVFNGEIYNFKSIRAELEARGRNFRGHSDTEVLLHAIAEYGCHETLRKIQGMFAFAVWDNEKRVLTMARDRAGEKPLYYGWNKGRFVFASELKALFQIPNFEKKIDKRALQFYFRYEMIPSPFCILEGLWKLNPGHYIEVSPDKGEFPIEQKSYWSHLDGRQVSADPTISKSAALESVEEVLTNVISEQMISDVPLGAFLSGGYDSATVVALMQKVSTRPVRTFTIGFQDPRYDEAPFAKAIAQHLGTDHTELTFNEKDALNVVSSLPEIYDEPFSDSSQLPTTVLAKLTKSQVSVCLSGDGGDELFGGYTRYFWAQEIWRTRQRVPSALRKVGSWGIENMPQSAMEGALAFALKLRGDKLGVSHSRQKIDKLRRIARIDNFFDLYENLLCSWTESPVVGAKNEMNPKISKMRDWTWDNADAMMMAIDFKTYLPDDIMVKVDRATMSVSLESRTPFLDARVVEAVGRIPTSLLMEDRVPKRLLKEICWKHVPKEMMERPKKGFGVPVDAWLRGELRGWAEDLLSEKQLSQHGLLDVATIRERWTLHQSGKADFGFSLWTVLNFQAWYKKWITPAA